MLPVIVVSVIVTHGEQVSENRLQDRTDYNGHSMSSRFRDHYGLDILSRRSFIDVTAVPVATPVLQPEPIPEPNPVVQSPQIPGDKDFDVILNTVFGLSNSKAYSVADCETGRKLSAGFDPFELNRTAVGLEGEVSIWQIHPVHFKKYDKDRLQADLEYAAQATWEISGFGSNWKGPWVNCG